ncbi:MAG: hypothetical protein PW844_08925 [Pantoea sp.]|uniref:hypothetical protein n=1 Tax=Pantoea sp. TaxID=69393 RepID=UPI00238F0363|nr:hypothetical protein [Pantoea sp.]MDE1186589.1 hypothetical protein [Pantoea sp.]
MKPTLFLAIAASMVFLTGGCQNNSPIYGNYSSEVCLQIGQNHDSNCSNSGDKWKDKSADELPVMSDNNGPQ